MTLDSPLARSATDQQAPDSNDTRYNSGTNPDGSQARPLGIVSRFGRWFPVAVNLTNVGDAADVTLSMRLSSTSDPSSVGSVSTFETRVDLPSGSSKRVWIYGRLERGACDMGEITLSGRGVSSLSRAFALSAPSDGARVVWTISDTGQNLSELSRMPQLRGPVDPAYSQYGTQNSNRYNNGNSIEALSATHDLVPERWIGLDGVDLVVLHDFAHTSLSTEQANTLRGYVAGGGSLLVLGGTNYQRLAASPLRDLWPVMPSGTREASSAQKNSLVSLLSKGLARAEFEKSRRATYVMRSLSSPNLTGADRLGGVPILVATGTADANARPLSPVLSPDLAAVKRYGAGRVEWLAFDPTSPPFVGWRGQEALWKPLVGNLNRPRRIEGVDARLETQGEVDSNSYSYNSGSGSDSILATLRGALSRSPQLRTPAASSIAWFLALYVFFLVPVNYVVLRSVDRRELAWVTVPLIVLAFSTLSYLAAVRIKGTELRARQVSIVQGSDASPVARADSMLWVFSPRKSAYSIEGMDAKGGADASMVSAVYADGRRSDALDNSLLRQNAGAGIAVDGAPINMWDYKSFVGQSIVPSSGGFVFQGSGASRVLINQTGQTFKGAAWVENGRVLPLGDLAPGGGIALPVGATKDKGSSNGGLSKLADLAAPVYEFDNVSTARDIASAALSVANVDLAKRKDGTYAPPTLVAWQQKPSSALAIEGEAPVRETVSLWMWRFTK